MVIEPAVHHILVGIPVVQLGEDDAVERVRPIRRGLQLVELEGVGAGGRDLNGTVVKPKGIVGGCDRRERHRLRFRDQAHLRGRPEMAGTPHIEEGKTVGSRLGHGDLLMRLRGSGSVCDLEVHRIFPDRPVDRNPGPVRRPQPHPARRRAGPGGIAVPSPVGIGPSPIHGPFFKQMVFDQVFTRETAQGEKHYGYCHLFLHRSLQSKVCHYKEMVYSFLFDVDTKAPENVEKRRGKS